MSLPRAATEPGARLLALSLAALTSLAACSPASGEPPAGASSSAAGLAAQSQSIPSGPHRVQVSGAAAEQLRSGGGTLIADYGSYALVDVDGARLAALPKDSFQLRDEYRSLLLNAGPIDALDAAAARLRATTLPATGRQLHLVQFSGTVKPEWYSALQATGVRIVAYVPHNGYLVWGGAPALARVLELAKSSSHVQWDGAYLDDYKINPRAYTTPADLWQIQLVEDAAANADTLARASAMDRSGKLIAQRALGYVDLVLHADRDTALSLARQPDVVSIYPYALPKKLDERADMIAAGQLISGGSFPSGPGYLAWLASKGFTQAQFDLTNVGVDVSDSGLDNGTQSPNAFALYKGGDITGQSRVVYNRLVGTPNAGSTLQGCDGHGNLNCNIIMAFNNLAGAPHADTSGYHYNLGIAPFARVGSSVIFDPNSFTFPDYEDLQSMAYQDGMRVSSNSWGAAAGGAYNADSQRYDALVRDAQPAASAVPAPGNQEMIIVFAAGNSGSGANTMGAPATAKNIITAGGANNVHPFGAADQCGVGDADADNANDITPFSSRGPCDDGRIKPDLVAGSTHVSGGVAQAAGQHSDPPGNLNGAQLACFDATGVCAGPGTSNFWPLSQQWTTASSGTSHSTPLIAGAALMARQYLINTTGATPSATLVKAYLLNGARYMTGSGANDNLYSNNQGMGHLDLSFALDSTPRFVRDEVPADLFTATGQVRTFNIYAADPAKPFRVTLAWTDAPGSTTGNSFNNNLDLTVTVGGNTYRGNVFSGRSSVTGGVADVRNNVESVFLPAGTTGPATVTVAATNINSDGVPGNASALDQDFALVAYNVCGTQGTAPTGATATASGPNQIRIDWTAAGGTNTDYHVYRGITSGGPYTQVGSVAVPTTTFTDTTVSGGATYFYVVRGVDCAESADSNEASATATGTCTNPPAFAGLTSATNAGTSTCGVNLAWSAAVGSCGGTIQYNVYRSRTAGFTPSASNRIATGVSGTSFTDIANLISPNAYSYVVRAVETAGATVNEDTNTVQQTATPTGAITPAVAYFDDLDATRPPNAAAYWLPSATTIQTTTACRYQSSNKAWRFGQASTACGGSYPISREDRLVLGGNGAVAGVNGFALPANTAGSTTRATLSFFHAWALEANFDGAFLEYSTAGAGGPWTPVPGSVTAGSPYIASGTYNGHATSNRPAWTGNPGFPANGSFSQTTVNVDALAGQTVWFAWHYVSDSSIVFEGHSLDDVAFNASAVASCTAGSTTPGPAVGYQVSIAPTVIVGVATNPVVRAIDAAEQTAVSYNGTANLTATDPLATYPASVALVAGVATPSVTFGTLGNQTLTATDAATPSFTASAGTLVTAGPPSQLAFSVQPSNAVAGASITPAIKVELRDQFGNLTNSTANVTLAIGTNPGGDVLHGTITVAAVAGVATFNAVNVQRAGNGYTLVASSGALPTATSAAFDITAAATAGLAFSQPPASSVAGAAFSPAVTVRVVDAYGNTTPSTVNVTAAIGTNPGGGTLSGTLTQAAVAGVATFANLSVDKVGTGYTLVATSAGLIPGNSAPFNITPGAPVRVLFGQQPTNIAAGNPITPAITVSVRDQFGNLCTQSTLDISVVLGGGTAGATLLGTTTVTAAAGVATFSDLSVDKAGLIYTLTAGSSGLFGATSVSFNVTAGAPASLAFTTQPPASSAAGAPFGAAVAILDQYGNRTSSTAAVTVALGTNPGGGTLSGTTTVNAVNGLATFSGLSADKVGTGYTLAATSGALPPATSSAFDITPGAAAALKFGAQPSSAVAGAAISPAVTVRVEDAFGNLVTASTANVTVAIGNNPPGSGTLSGATSAAASAGVATFSDLSIDKVGGGYTLAASSGSLTSATSAAFDITPAAAVSLFFRVQPGTSVAGMPIVPYPSGPTVEVHDAFGNVVPGFSGSILMTLINAGSATLEGVNPLDAPLGEVTFALSIRKAGTGYQLVASSAGLTSATSSAFDVVPGAPASLAFVAQPPSSQANSAFSASVAISDAFGNLVTGATNTVTLAIGTNPSGGTLSGTATADASGGVAAFSGLSIDKAGTGYTLTASSSGLTPAESSPFDIGAGPAAGLQFEAQPSSAVAGAAIAPAIVVRVVDASGNTATGGDVTLAIGNNAGGGALSGTATVTSVNGRAAFSTLSIDKAGTGYTLTAASSGLTGATSAAFDIRPGPATHLAITGLPAGVQETVETSFSIQALDANENPAPDDAGTVRITSDDARATLPADVTLASGAASNVRITFRTPGAHTVTATDVATASITGTASTSVSAFAPPAVTLDGVTDGEAVSGTVHVTASGSASAGTTLAKLEIFVDGASLANASTSPLGADWDTTTLPDKSTHTVTATATDATGKSSTTAAITVTVEHKGCGCSSMGGMDVGALAALGVVLRALALRRRRSGR